MRFLVSGIFSALVFAVAANAGDLGAPAYGGFKDTPALWTGFYIGANAGGTWSQTNNNGWAPGCSTDPLNFQCFGEFPITGNMAGKGASTGVHFGYNRQFLSSYVLGVEGDLSWTDTKSSLSKTWISTDPVAHPGGLRPGAATSLSSQEDWISTVRARFGYVLTPSTMVYATGGAAWAQVNNSALAHNETSSFVSSASTTRVAPGWVAGGGVEVALGSNWSLRGEYLHYDLKTSDSPANNISFQGNPILFRSTYTWGNTTIESVRGGLSYKF
jgi:outer membrane immunogenic protein